ncbi:MAG: Hsp20/alpha crystallin family protein [Rhodomicrobiaceae bacterium]
MAVGKKRAAPKRPSAPKHSAGAAGGGFAGARPKNVSTDPRISVGGNFRAGSAGTPFGLDNLFSWLGGVVEKLNDVADKAEKGAFDRQGEFKVEGLGEKGRGIYGVSVKMGLGGEPAVQTFGNIRPTKKGPEVSDVREPLVDIFDEGKDVLVVAEMPGVAETDITVKASGSSLKINTKGEFHYAKEVDLPANVKPKPLRKTYRNGLLELRFAKA